MKHRPRTTNQVNEALRSNYNKVQYLAVPGFRLKFSTVSTKKVITTVIGSQHLIRATLSYSISFGVSRSISSFYLPIMTVHQRNIHLVSTRPTMTDRTKKSMPYVWLKSFAFCLLCLLRVARYDGTTLFSSSLVTLDIDDL